MVQPTEIVSFWLNAGPEKWYQKDEAFDASIRDRFGEAVARARDGAFEDWLDRGESALALLILLDQFPRNIYRGDALSFGSDARAREVAERAIRKGHDMAYDRLEVRRFFYLPFMHSEDLADQERCIALCKASDDEGGIHYGELHAEIIRKFGRFPHRNGVLGRETTPDEQAFLDSGGFAG